MNNLHFLQKELLEVYESIRQICDSHGFRYYASGGTALGAMRHRGFIPWDDDFDIEMPRKDYEQFCEVAERELPIGLRLVHLRNTYGYNYLFAKVVCTDESRVGKIEEAVGFELTQGLFVDIFPTDGFPKSKLRLLFRLIARSLIKARECFLNGYLRRRQRKEFSEALVGMLFPPWKRGGETYWDLLKAEERVASECPEEKSATMGGNVWAQREWLNFNGRWNLTAADFGEAVSVPFEETIVPVARNYDKYLTTHYGNWRQLPPIEKRVPSHGDGIFVPWRYGFTHIIKQPILSIVIANYNYGRFIGSAIKSIVDQCWGVAKGPNGQIVLGLPNDESIELIIVDGGSADDSVDVIRHHASQITWWCSEKDRGQSDAFNKGFSHATGKYLTWVNADDLMTPGSLLSVTGAMKRHTNCEWFTGNFFWFRDSDSIVTEVCWGSNYYPKILQRKDSPVHVFGPSSFFSRRLYDLVGGVDVRFHNTMDTFLWIKFIQMGIKQRRVRKMCWAFRLHEGAKTAEFKGYERDKSSIAQSERERKIVRDETGYRSSRVIYFLIWIWRMFDFSIICKIWMSITHRTKSSFGVGEYL